MARDISEMARDISEMARDISEMARDIGNHVQMKKPWSRLSIQRF